jgi:hypothetical protein
MTVQGSEVQGSKVKEALKIGTHKVYGLTNKAKFAPNWHKWVNSGCI